MKRFLTIALFLSILFIFIQDSTASIFPDEEGLSNQYGLKAVRAPQAWNFSTGNPNVYVAVLDSGIDFSHPDLINNFASNYSKNILDESESCKDDDGHGTNVAGIIGAFNPNGSGVFGVSLKSKIIAFKVLKSNGKGREDYAVKALKEVLKMVTDENNSVKIAAVNLSLGGNFDDKTPSECSNDNNEYWKILHELDATNKVVIVVAAGNEGIEVGSATKTDDPDQKLNRYKKGQYNYPASFLGLNNMIVVANAKQDSLAKKYELYSSSNYSVKNVHIAAPGTGILSTFSSVYDKEKYTDTIEKGNYYRMTGTSQAAPFVSGAVALLASKYPSATASQIKEAILKGANSYYSKSYCSNGLLNIEGAFAYMEGKNVPYGVPIDDFNFPDKKFRSYIAENFDTNKNGYLHPDEINAVEIIDVANKGVDNIEGIELFKNLVSLDCSGVNIGYELLNFSNFSSLVSLKMSNCNLETINGIVGLAEDSRNLRKIASLDISGNNFEVLELSDFPALKYLNLKGCKNLVELNCSGNGIIHNLDISNCSKLKELNCADNLISELDLSGCYQLQSLNCSKNNISELNLQNCVNLKKLDCSKNWMSELNLDKLSNLQVLSCQENKLPTLDLSKCYQLQNAKLNCGNQLVHDLKLTVTSPSVRPYSFNLSDIMGKEKLVNIVPESIRNFNSNVDPNPKEIYEFDVKTGVVSIGYEDDKVEYLLKPFAIGYKYKTNPSNSNENFLMDVTVRLSETLAKEKELKSGDIRIDFKNFPDDNFREYIKNFDLDSDGILSYSERMSVDEMWQYNKNISTLEGIQYFPNITILNCSNNKLTFLDVSELKSLKRLDCSYNCITYLDVSNHEQLESLYCENNNMKNLYLRKCPYLGGITCENNSLTTLDCSDIQSYNTQMYLLYWVYSYLSYFSASNQNRVVKLKETGDSKYPYKINLLEYMFSDNFLQISPDIWACKDNKEYSVSNFQGANLLLAEKPSSISYNLNNGLLKNHKYLIGYRYTYGFDSSHSKYLREVQTLPVTLTIEQAPVIKSATLSKGKYGASYNAQVEIENSKAVDELNWSVIGNLPKGLSLNKAFRIPAGEISGTPLEHGNFTFSICVSNDTGTDIKTFDLFIEGIKPEIKTSSLSEGKDGEDYEFQLYATGYPKPEWSCTGTLPNGISFDKTGLIKGKPTECGEFTLRFTASNDVDYSSKSYKLFIDGIKPLISTEVLPDATVNEPYEFQLEYSGSEVLEWYEIRAYHLFDDNHFSGLRKDIFDFSCSPTGLISGTPTIVGNAAILVGLKNPIGSTLKTYYIFVKGTKPVINFDKLPEGKDGQYYKFSFTSSGIGLQETQFSVKGTLPSGLKINRDSYYKTYSLEGTPSVSGTFPLTIVASNDVGYDKKNFNLIINGIKPEITTSEFKTATAESFYYDNIQFSGSKPATWKYEGTLPEGISLKGNYLSGTTKQTGKFPLKITVSNSAGSDTKNLELLVNGKKPVIDKNYYYSNKDYTYYSVFSNPLTIHLANLKEPKFKFSGTEPIKWTYTGTLPEGMSLKDGILSGKPKQSGEFPIVVCASNDWGHDTIDITLKIENVRPIIQTTELKQGKVGISYSQTLESYGADVIWTASGLPSGLTLNETSGKISGKPKKGGTFTINITATNPLGTLSKSLPLVIEGIKISGDITAKGVVKKSYSSSISVSGGTSPYTWTKSSGTLPKGLELVPNSKGTKLTIKGTPTTAKTYNFTLKVTDKNKISISQKFMITVTKPTISGDITAKGVVKKSYSSNISISKGTSPYTWAKSSGTLPAGLKLTTNTSGTKLYLKGTPTTAKAYTFTLKATDKNGATASKKFTVTITKPTISDDIKASGVIKKSYSSAITISGGTSPYTWVKSSGTLPAGITLNPNSTGTKLTLKGTPTTAKAYTFTLKATDKNGATASKKFTVTITKPVISGDITASGVIKKSYSSSISISGGTSPYKWTKSSGTLPAGLTLNPNSTGTKLTLKGTPITAKAYTFTLKATDKNGATASKKFTVTITKPTISGTLTVSGTVKSSYSSSISVSKGTSPYKWAKSKGTLPAGLKLSTNSSGTKLYLKGTPTTAKAYTFTLKATDKNGATASKEFTVTIAKATSNKSGESAENNVSKNTKDFSNIQNVAIPDVVAIPDEGSTYVPQGLVELKVSSDILWHGEGKNEDLIGVQANEPLTFFIENSPSDMRVIIDDKATEGIEIDEGSFTLPAEFVSDDFKVRAENDEIETNEILISVEK